MSATTEKKIEVTFEQSNTMNILLASFRELLAVDDVNFTCIVRDRILFFSIQSEFKSFYYTILPDGCIKKGCFIYNDEQAEFINLSYFS